MMGFDSTKIPSGAPRFAPKRPLVPQRAGVPAGAPAIASASTSNGVAIIGYGVAGVNCAIALRCAGYTGPIRVFSATSTPPYSPILTSYYAGGEKSYEECFPWTEAELVDLDLDSACLDLRHFSAHANPLSYSWPVVPDAATFAK